jgi:hypothetical protein
MDPSGRGQQQNDGPLINVSPGRHPGSSSNVHPLPTSSLQVNADEAGTLRRPPYAWWMRAVVHLGVPCCRASSYSYLPEGTHRVAAEERGVVRCRGCL